VKYSPTLISIIALFVSLGGMGISLWSTFISKNSFEHTLMAQRRADDEDFEKLRLDVLMQIADLTEITRQYLIKVNTLKIKYDSEPLPVQDLMKNYTNIFTDYLPRVVFTLKSLDYAWKNVSSYSEKNDYKKLIHDKANLYLAWKANEALKPTVQSMIDEFDQKLKTAEKDAPKLQELKNRYDYLMFNQ
jgi:L-amino acid N-acyltransferase YncA